MYKCPINYFCDNLLFNQDGGCFAVFRLRGFDYDYRDDESKIMLLNRTARFLAGTMSELQILMVPVEQDNKAHFARLRGKMKKTDPLYRAAMNHMGQTEEYLREKTGLHGCMNDYRFYLVAKLQEDGETELADNAREAFQYFLKNPANALHVFLNMDTKDVLKSSVRKYKKLAAKWFHSQNQKLRLEEPDGDELQWLIRRMAYRGLNERIPLFRTGAGEESWKPEAAPMEVGEETILKPYGRDVENLFSGAITSKGRTVAVSSGGRTSYQTFLSITNLPDVVEFPGQEWLYMLQHYNCQAEVCIHIKAAGYRTSLRKIDGKKREINSQMEHIAEADADLPEDLMEGKEYSEALEQEVKNDREPVLDVAITICLASDNADSLEEKAATIRNAYEDMNFVVERPIASQIKLYMQCIPSVRGIVRDYVMHLTPMTLASGVIGAIHELGDKLGPYIGSTGREEKQVYLDMGHACLLNHSASATFTGDLGFGKSFNANLLMLLNVLYGGYGLIFDPKGERSHWEKEFLLLKGMVTTVTLSSDPAGKGKLDPYNIYREDINLANELMLNVVAELFKIQPTSTEYTALLEAARIIAAEAAEMPEEKERKRASMSRVIEVLEDFPAEDELQSQARFLARRLRLQSAAGMSRLLIGDGTEDAVSLGNRLNILQIQNLKLPSPETPKEDYTNEETLSTVLMMVVSHFARIWALVQRKTFKCILFDESWALGKTAEGVKLYDYLARMGRSLYTGVIFNGHTVLDIPTEGIKNTITYKFCFHTGNDAEAARMCDYLGIQDTEDNREAIKSLGNGQCFFRDLAGHVGILQFDAVFEDIIETFSTTPETEEQQAEEARTEEPQKKERKPEIGKPEIRKPEIQQPEARQPEIRQPEAQQQEEQQTEEVWEAEEAFAKQQRTNQGAGNREPCQPSCPADINIYQREEV